MIITSGDLAALLFAVVDAVVSAWLCMVSTHALGCCSASSVAHERMAYWTGMLGWWRSTW